MYFRFGNLVSCFYRGPNEASLADSKSSGFFRIVGSIILKGWFVLKK